LILFVVIDKIKLDGKF